MTSNATCSGCGTAVAPANVLYSADARVVCAKCFANADIVETDKRHANTIKHAAYGCMAGGVVTFFSPLSGFLVIVIGVAVATFFSGIYALRALAGDQPRFTKHLTAGDRTLIWVFCIAGMGIAGLMSLAVLSGLAGMFYG